MEKPHDSKSGKEISEQKKSSWIEKLKELENVTDRLGMPIDSNMFETIAALNLLNIPTTSSCGGHLPNEEYGRIGFPYFGGHVPDEPKSRFLGEEELRLKIAEKYNVDPNKVDRDKKSLHEYWDVIQNEDYQETVDYVQWTIQNKSIKEKVAKLLDEFYKDIETPPIIRLHIARIFPGYRVESVDDVEIEGLIKSGISEEKRIEKLEEYIRSARDEMSKFTEFLKNRYFSD